MLFPWPTNFIVYYQKIRCTEFERNQANIAAAILGKMNKYIKTIGNPQNWSQDLYTFCSPETKNPKSRKSSIFMKKVFKRMKSF